MKYFIGSLLILFSSFSIDSKVYVGDFVSYQTKDVVKSQLLNDLRVLEKNWNITKEHDFGQAEAQSSLYYVWPRKFKLYNIEIKHVKLIADKLSDFSVIVNDDETKLGFINDSIFKLVFGFEYDASSGFYGGSGEGEIEITSNDGSFFKIFQFSGGDLINTRAEFKSDFRNVTEFKLFVGDYANEIWARELGIKAFQQVMKEPQYIYLVDKIGIAISDYYKQNQLVDFTFQLNYPIADYYLDLSKMEIPKLKAQDGAIIYYFNGAFKRSIEGLRNFDSYKRENSVISRAEFDDFDIKDGNFQFLIRHELLNDIFEHSCQNAACNFALRKSEITTENEMTVSEISDFYPGIIKILN